MSNIEHYDWGVSPFKDVIDSRDVRARIEELDETETRTDSETAELAALHALAASDIEDWEYGASLIRDTYFQTYAQESAEDIGAIEDSASWPHYCIDWERAARELQMDYTSVTFDGVTYWVR